MNVELFSFKKKKKLSIHGLIIKQFCPCSHEVFAVLLVLFLITL